MWNASTSKKYGLFEGNRSNTSLSKEGSTENKSDIETEESEQDATPMVVLSIIYEGNKLGAASYNIDTCHLCLMPDHIDTAPSFSVLKLLLKQVEPVAIITSHKIDENILNILKEINIQDSSIESNDSSYDARMGKNRLHILPNIDFAFEASRYKLQNLNIQNIPNAMSDFERQIHISSLIDFTKVSMVKAAGALLKFVEKDNLGQSLESKSTTVVSGISSLSLKSILNMDENSYRALQIFQEERHPSVYKTSFGIKEGLSLYGICNRCKSAIGKKELKRWFYMPTNNLDIIKERQASIKYFIAPEHTDILLALQTSLKHIKFLPRILTRMKTAQATRTDWQTLYKTSYHSMLISDIARANSHGLEIFKKISSTFSGDLFRIANLLNKIIDFDEYTKLSHFVVKPGVDLELDKMKRIYNGLPDFMTKVAFQELQELNDDIPQCSVIYLPQLGYLLALPATKQMKETKNYNISNLQYMFILNDMVHYKSDKTKKLDSMLGDTLCNIYDKETQIMHRLQNIILEMKLVLFDVMKYTAKLDCLIALAVIAKENNWIQPEITNSNQLVIINGRHPLQEMCVPSFVSNSTYSGGLESRIKVLTGPNSSGKSIYLKQVALLVFMSHLGSFIPAQKAEIPVFDNIFTCISVTESVSLNLSSFLISLNQLSCALCTASKMSLVVIDEFGKFTETESGEALNAASLYFWMLKGSSSPHIFLATHFLNLSRYFINNDLIKFQTMEIIENEDLVYLYQLVDGIASSSLAVYTASRAGVPKETIKRSLSILEALKSNQPITLQEKSRIHEKIKRHYSIYDKFLRYNAESDDITSILQYVKETAQISPLTSNNSSSI